MDISRSAAGENIPVREDCVVSEPVIRFLFPLGKISSKKSKTGVTFLWEKSDIQQWRDKIFEKSLEGVLQNRGVILIISGEEL